MAENNIENSSVNNTGNNSGRSSGNQPRKGSSRRVPVWMLVVIILCTLPGLTFPMFEALSASSDTAIRGLTWFYPLYSLISGFLAWQCYGRRTLMTWIILALLVVSHICFHYLGSLGHAMVNYN